MSSGDKIKKIDKNLVKGLYMKKIKDDVGILDNSPTSKRVTQQLSINRDFMLKELEEEVDN